MSTPAAQARVLSRSAQMLQALVENVERVVRGKHTEVELAIIGLAAQGHVLIEDVPGVGKTMLAKSLARSLGCSFKRLQFTPDLLPSDVTGTSVFDPRNATFEFHPGPIVAQIVLADEINRATPKTQSALLEAMEERQITVDGITYPLPTPFIVLATQNPIEYEGTFPLPEAQLDRFLIRIHLGYPSAAQEVEILQGQRLHHPLEDLRAILEPLELAEVQDSVRQVYIESSVQRYIVQITASTRAHPDVYLGASPRGSLSLMRASQARALLYDRGYVIPDDVKTLAASVLCHRLILRPESRVQGATPQSILSQILAETPVPGARASAA